jgi:hypoxanthine phosphoribosyltransferase
MKNLLVGADDLLRDSFQLAADIYKAGFAPDFLVGLWRGGSAVGIAVQEGLEHFGVDTDHIAIRTSYSGQPRYSEMVGRADQIRVHGLQYLLENLSSKHSLLIVDDVYSTGSSVAAVIRQLERKTRRNMPHDIRIASVWYRPNERTLRAPDYFVRETNDWLILPYELSGMSIDELRRYRPELGSIIDRLEPFVGAGEVEPAG